LSLLEELSLNLFSLNRLYHWLKFYGKAMRGKRKEEEFCKQKLNDHLKQLLPETRLCWQEGDEPPDYYLYLNDARYAIEITSLVARVTVGDDFQPMQKVIASLKNLLWQVKEEANSVDENSGHYHVHFSRPINNLKSVSQELKRSILSYILKAKGLGYCDGEIVFSQVVGFYRQYCKIQKMKGGLGANITMSGPLIFRGGGEVKKEICKLLRERLVDKMGKLSRLNDPKIIVFYDSYGFASIRDFQSCFLGREVKNFFCKIFIIKGDDSCFCIHPKANSRVA